MKDKRYIKTIGPTLIGNTLEAGPGDLKSLLTFVLMAHGWTFTVLDFKGLI